MYSLKFEYDKEESKKLVREILSKAKLTIDEEKNINNGLGYKFRGHNFAIILYYKANKSSKLVFERAGSEVIDLFTNRSNEADDESGGVVKSVPIHTSIKITDKARIEELKKQLIGRFENSNISEDVPRAYYRLQIQKGEDRFTLTQYETGTLLLQGQSTNLFYEVLEIVEAVKPLNQIENALLYVPQESQEQVKCVLEADLKKFEHIESLAEKRVSAEAFNYLFRNDQQTLVSAMGILETVRNNNLCIPMYNPILYPFAKVFEGFVIKLMIDKAFFSFEDYKKNPEIADIGNALWKNKFKKYIKDLRRNEFVLSKLATTWESLRCHELHSDPAQDDRIINLTDIDQVDNRIGEIAATIIDAYRILIANGYTEEDVQKGKQQSLPREDD